MNINAEGRIAFVAELQKSLTWAIDNLEFYVPPDAKDRDRHIENLKKLQKDYEQVAMPRILQGVDRYTDIARKLKEEGRPEFIRKINPKPGDPEWKEAEHIGKARGEE